MNETEDSERLSNLQQYLPQWVMENVYSLLETYNDTVEQVIFVLLALTYSCVMYSIISALTYSFLPKVSSTSYKKRVLIVTAHPDDECMFFGPTILKLGHTCDIYLLCLSIGSHKRELFRRKKELYKSCKVFGIPPSNIMVMNHSRMPDDPNRIWNARRTAKILMDHIEIFSIDEVYTFDVGGVSGHLNHISIFYAFARLCVNGELPSCVKVYLLDSVNILRKYSIIFDASLSSLPITKRLFVVNLADSDIVREAMRQHDSQMVWYRYIYIYLSRYMYINTYKELEVEDVQLVLQMSDYNPLVK